jgi:hypothetical protein
MENFNNEQVYFVDTETGLEIQLEEGTEIPVSIMAGEYTDRFYLNFWPEMLVTGIDRNKPKESYAAYYHGGNLHVSYSGNSTDTDVTVALYDMSGRTVMNATQYGVAGGQAMFDMHMLANGVYVARILSSGAEFTQKIMKY